MVHDRQTKKTLSPQNIEAWNVTWGKSGILNSWLGTYPTGYFSNQYIYYRYTSHTPTFSHIKLRFGIYSYVLSLISCYLNKYSSVKRSFPQFPEVRNIPLKYMWEAWSAERISHSEDSLSWGVVRFLKRFIFSRPFILPYAPHSSGRNVEIREIVTVPYGKSDIRLHLYSLVPMEWTCIPVPNKQASD